MAQSRESEAPSSQLYTTMRPIMADLEAENKRLGGLLCVSLGKDGPDNSRHRALVFLPTVPRAGELELTGTEQQSSISVNIVDRLVASRVGFRVIRAIIAGRNSQVTESYLERIEEYLWNIRKSTGIGETYVRENTYHRPGLFSAEFDVQLNQDLLIITNAHSVNEKFLIGPGSSRFDSQRGTDEDKREFKSIRLATNPFPEDSFSIAKVSLEEARRQWVRPEQAEAATRISGLLKP